MGLDAEALRRDFPILNQEVDGKPLVYLDSAASSQKPRAVIDAVARYYLRDHANVHRGVHELARRATRAYEESRRTVAAFLGAEDPSELIFTRGATESLNLAAYSLMHDGISKGDEIIISTMEHHSNIVPWQLVSGWTGARIRFLEISAEGELELEGLERLLRPQTKVVALSHVSNALGTINPVRKIARLVRERSSARFVVDGAQGAPHLPVDIAELGCDMYAFSGHKMCGPTGIGGLWARRKLLDALPPFHGGGEMIERVRRSRSTFAKPPHKFEAGTPNIAGAVGLARAVEYLSEIGPSSLHDHETRLTRLALSLLSEIDGLRVLGPSSGTERAGVVPFVVDGLDAQDIATLLDTQGIAVRAGHHCAQLVVDRFGVPATVRASFYLYNTLEEVRRLAQGVRSVVRMLR